MMHPVSFLIVFFVALWATDIGEEEKFEGGPTKTVKGVSRVKPKVQPPEEIRLKTLPKVKSIKIDEDAFHLSFRRQSLRVLVPCLEKNLSPSGRISLAAVLDENGKLSNIAPPETTDFPHCANEAIESMNFDKIVPKTKGFRIVLHWQLIW